MIQEDTSFHGDLEIRDLLLETQFVASFLLQDFDQAYTCVKAISSEALEKNIFLQDLAHEAQVWAEYERKGVLSKDDFMKLVDDLRDYPNFVSLMRAYNDQLRAGVVK